MHGHVWKEGIEPGGVRKGEPNGRPSLCEDSQRRGCGRPALEAK
ncbi:hypothetical protein SFOMI_1681 [Sphingobium fuliginis]|uniref:Uncharacterized protein n=1 Tax=Sphingobium fuliginis (strain ATCC 27551) TaxID=336203 RepID=A0A292ZE22_SPHSA|nr:hypothetical protein SFOMI_1681 [Sphingobium fuliginis]